ncbi:MAG TPA: caspase family protein [Polyangiaceae bacterium]
MKSTVWAGVFALALLSAACQKKAGGDGDHGVRAELEPSASEHRLALILGSNTGSGERPPLRYAEHDARKMARVLAEVGGVPASDVHLVLAGSLARVRQELDAIRRSAEATKARHAASRVVLLFYFSGHSDGEALELGRERLTFSELRGRLRDTGAGVRLGIIDACRSGAVIGVKGGTPGPGFDVTLLGLPALSGEAFLSASRADEVALESREIGGSFFTHHLVSGLRGAADADRNHLVTLEELYRHTAARTSSAAARTLYGDQTPAYDYRLVGHGDLVLSDLRGVRPVVYVPGGFDRVVIFRKDSELAEAETAISTGQNIALPPGEYLLRGQREATWYRASARVSETAGQISRVLDFVQETPAPAPESRPIADITRDFRPGNGFPSALPKTNPYFCEPTEGNWKGCRNGGCTVCAEMVHGFPNYFRNHPNCIPSMTCEGRYFTCSANCPPPTAADSCDPDPQGWLGCNTGCTVCTLEIADYPRYFENHPNCAPMPGRCNEGPGRCSPACPAPGPEDR